MLIVRMLTGLANQMLQYMTGYALAQELNQELVLDIALCANSSFGYLLDNFKIPDSRKIVYSQISIEAEEAECCDSALKYFDDAIILVEHSEQKNLYLNNERVVLYTGLDMANELKKYKNLYMCGYFFDKDMYYEKYWNQLQSFFVLKEESDSVKEFRQLIYGKISVGIHIRRGDMLLMDWAYKMEDDYYRAAIECCKELYTDCIFCVFSDDIEYAKSILGDGKSIYYIHFWGYDDASVNEFYCLSLCTHRIVTADSTFGEVAHELNLGKEKCIFVRDTKEESIGKSLLEKSKQNSVFINRDDIREYSQKYVYIKKATPEADNALKVQRFFELVEENKCHEALQLAFCIYNERKDDAKFKIYLAEALIRIGIYEESIIEIAQLPQTMIEEWFRNIILDQGKKKELLQLYHEISRPKKQHFIIVLMEKAMPCCISYGLIDLALILSHIGHQVTLVYEPYDNVAEYFLNKSKFLHNDREINLGCLHVEKNYILKTGVSEFYNNFAEEKLIVISRDERFFVNENCNKKLQFITTDDSDLEDEEIISMISKNIFFKTLVDKADIVFTQDRDLARDKEKYVFWQSEEYPEKFRFITHEWKYGYNQRLNRRMFGMVKALSEICQEYE